MRKLYGILLFALFTINATQERPTFFSRTRQFTVRFKEKFLRKIKQQYRDKQKRRAWLSSGVIGLAGLLSWRFGAFHKIWERKKEKAGTVEGDQPPKDVHDRLRAQSDKVQATRRALVKKHRTSTSPHDASDRSDNRKAFRAAMKIAEKLGIPPVKGTGDGASNLVRFDGQPPPSARTAGKSRDGTTAIKTDDEIQRAAKGASFETGTCVCAGKSPADPLSNRKAEPKPFYGPDATIEHYIKEYHVVSRLKKLKRSSGVAQAKETMAQKLEDEYNILPLVAKKVVARAVEMIKQNRQLREAISAGDWNSVVELLPNGVTPKKKSKVTRILENIAQRGTLSVQELNDLNLIIWQLVQKDNAPIKPEDRAKIEDRNHSDRGALLAMLPPPKSPPS